MSGPGPHELVIIRRRGGGDDAAPKGGVWKIAFADFMTAMMAFFLVMWLINASNEATRSQVASYFNPIKLTDSSTGDKGLAASKTKPKDKKTEPAAEAKTGEAAEGAVATEEKLLSNPYTALDRVVAEHPRNSNGPGAAAGPAGADAFESLSWMAPPKTTVDAALRPEPPPPKSEVKAVAKSADVKEKVPAAVSAEKAPERSVKAAEAIKHEIFEKLKAAGQPLPAKIEVKPAGSGVLISLIDRHELNMFAVGSAEPSAELIRAVSSIAAGLKTRKGGIDRGLWRRHPRQRLERIGARRACRGTRTV